MRELEALRDESFVAKVECVSTAEGLHDYLARMPEVRSLTQALMSGVIVIPQVEGFVRRLFEEFHPNRRFWADPVLAGIAVAVSLFPGRWVDVYLRDLAQLRIKELPLSHRVADIVLARRYSAVPATQYAQSGVLAPGNVSSAIMTASKAGLNIQDDATRVSDAPPAQEELLKAA